jgi:hypothetical protein
MGALSLRLFDGFGYTVQLTVRSRDRGRDGIAADHQDRRKYLIECKRYREEKVGLGIVQRLNGVVQGKGRLRESLLEAKNSNFSLEMRAVCGGKRQESP